MARRIALVLPISDVIFADHARSNGWDPIDDQRSSEPVDEDRPVWWWSVPGGDVRFTDDTVLRVQYVDILAEPAGPIEDVIQAEFTCYDKDDCLDVLSLDDPEETVCYALRLLACTAPGEVDPQVIEAAEAALRDSREGVRVYALQVAIYTEWEEFLPVVSQLAADESSDRVRGFANNAKMILELAQQIEAGSQ